VCASVVVVAGVVGCGGDGGGADGGGGTTEPRRFSAASEPPEVFAERMAKLLETTRTKRECAELDEIAARSLTQFSCPPSKSLSRSMARFEVVGVEEYGTGAIVDYASGDVRDGAAIVLFAAPDRNWAVSRFGVVTEPNTKTSDEESRAGFRKAVEDYLAAIRARDCKAFVAVAFTGDNSTEAACETIFPGTRVLAKRLSDNPASEPEYEGGNATYGFFRLETGKPTAASSTISVVADTADSASGYVVLDTAPSVTIEQQREAIEGLRRSRERREEPERSPSRKVESQ
jgi:hypothetical protein